MATEENVLIEEKAEIEHRERMARAFNKGSDARIRGEQLTDNPYPSSSNEATNWRYGWVDVHRYWGVSARGDVPAIPDVPLVIVDRRLAQRLY